jgi:hypothetical protein
VIKNILSYLRSAVEAQIAVANKSTGALVTPQRLAPRENVFTAWTRRTLTSTRSSSFKKERYFLFRTDSSCYNGCEVEILWSLI